MILNHQINLNIFSFHKSYLMDGRINWDDTNSSMDNIPDDVTHIIFDKRFDFSIDDLPYGITQITFGRDFDQYIDFLPESVTHITFGKYFNKPIDHLPNSITHINFAGDQFRHRLDKLPSSVTHITFGKYYDESIDKLPSSVTHITITNPDPSILETLPNTVRWLYIIYTDVDFKFSLHDILSRTNLNVFVDGKLQDPNYIEIEPKWKK
jgi:hypothetical protein